jgi:hypothetical protein
MLFLAKWPNGEPIRLPSGRSRVRTPQPTFFHVVKISAFFWRQNLREFTLLALFAGPTRDIWRRV